MDFQEITLKRGPCFGPCPVYQVTVYSDGSVQWVGDSFVKEEGPRDWTIEKGQVDALRKALRRAKFKDFLDRYDNYNITDCASATIIVKFDDEEVKQVYHYFGYDTAPPKLNWLEKKIDEIAGTEPYVGSSPWRDA
ncbi:MAG TPA: DUF6438 domain-containing protein [Pontiella sp.]